MKMLRLAAALALFLAASPAVAQWQTPNHSVPIGRGTGVTGFGSALPGAAGRPFISNGASADPSFGQAANVGIAPGAADTYKGSLNGSTTSDVAWPSCTGLGQAIRYGAGVGPNCGTVVATTGFDMPVNLGLSASAASSSLTLTVTQASGSAPTAGNPVVVPFRSTTLTSGAVTTGSISSTLSITIPSGATLGTSNSTAFRIWIFLDANGGTPALGVATCSNATNIFPCVAWESTLKTSTTIGAGSTAAGTLYAAAGVASDAVRIIGYCDYSSGLATAGAWLSACTTLQVVGPGVKKPGDIVQTVQATQTGQTTTTAGTPATASATALTVSIVPTNTVNLIQADARGMGFGAAAQPLLAQISRGSGPTYFGSIGVIQNNVAGSASMNGLDKPQTTSSTAYAVYIWLAAAAGTGSWLTTGYGATGIITVSEVMG